MYAFLTRSVLAFPRGWWVIGLLGLRGLGELALLLARPRGLPRGLVLTQLKGALAGPFLYVRARSRAREIEREFGPQARIGAA